MDEILAEDKCLASCIFMQAKLLTDDETFMQILRTFKNANKHIKLNKITDGQFERFLDQCLGLMKTSGVSETCEQGSFLLKCFKEKSVIYKFKKTTCVISDRPVNISVIDLMPNQDNIMKAYDYCWEELNVQFVYVHQLYDVCKTISYLVMQKAIF